MEYKEWLENKNGLKRQIIWFDLTKNEIPEITQNMFGNFASKLLLFSDGKVINIGFLNGYEKEFKLEYFEWNIQGSNNTFDTKKYKYWALLKF